MLVVELGDDCIIGAEVMCVAFRGGLQSLGRAGVLRGKSDELKSPFHDSLLKVQQLHGSLQRRPSRRLLILCTVTCKVTGSSNGSKRKKSLNSLNARRAVSALLN